MTSVVEVHGHVEPRFDAVREAFATNFVRHGDVGAACAVYHHGRLVVDVWAARGRERRGSGNATRGSVSERRACGDVLLQCRAGATTSMSDRAIWPGSRPREAAIPVRGGSHKAGLAAIDAPHARRGLAWDPVAAIARSDRMGARHEAGYHARSRLDHGELVRA